MKELRTLVMVFLRPLEKWVAEGMNGLAIPAGEHCLTRVDCTAVLLVLNVICIRTVR